MAELRFIQDFPAKGVKFIDISKGNGGTYFYIII